MAATVTGTSGARARAGRTRPLVLLLAWAVVGGALGGCAGTPTGPGTPMVRDSHGHVRARGPTRKITQEELTQRLMAFADRYLSRISEATDKLKRDATDPQVRRAAHATKFFPASAIITFAAEPDPVAGMLDILTVVTLERMVWQDTGWAIEVFGAGGAEVLRKAQVDAENDAWSCAAAVLPPERLRDVRQVIVDWQHAHPQNRYVSTMRFDDFAADGGERARRASDAARAASGGFLAPINEATRAVDATRMWGERFLFVTGRLQRMMSWQAELLVYDLASAPEVKQTLANHLSMTDSIRRFATSVEQWPAVISRERAALLKDLTDETGAIGAVVTNIRAALKEAQPVAADVRVTAQSAALVAADLRAAVREAGPVVAELARLSGKPPLAPAGAAPAGPSTAPATAPAAAPAPIVAAAAVPDAAPAAVAPAVAAPASIALTASPGAAPAAAGPVSAAPAPAPPVATARPFDILEYERVVRELRGLIESTDSLLENKAWQARLSEVNSAAETRVAQTGREGRDLINYGFYRGVFFAVFCAALLFVTALLYRLVARRLFPPHLHPTVANAPRATPDHASRG